jgi:hypothetical protein
LFFLVLGWTDFLRVFAESENETNTSRKWNKNKNKDRNRNQPNCFGFSVCVCVCVGGFLELKTALRKVFRPLNLFFCRSVPLREEKKREEKRK